MGWVCLFNCVTVRAIHFRIDKGHDVRAVSACTQTIYGEKRETPLISLDSAPQFKIAKTAIDKAWKETISNHEVQSYTANQGIEWNFLVELALWMGGFYERLVGTVKGTLKKSRNPPIQVQNTIALFG